MFTLISLLFIPSLSYSFDVEETGKPPVITPVNDSFVKINYQEAFKIKDFSKVDKIEFYSTQPGREKSEYFALAGHYDHSWIDESQRLIQPLVEGVDLFARMNPCKTYHFLYVRINGKEGHLDSIQFENKPGKMCEETFHYWTTLTKTSEWICVNRRKEIRFFKKEWHDDFYINEIHFGDQMLEFGDNAVENIPDTLNVELTITIGRTDVYFQSDDDDMMTESFHYQLTYCADQSSFIPYIIGIVGVLVVIIVIIATVLISRYSKTKAIKDSQVSKDVNPTYGETGHNDGYYTETKVTDNNEDYNKEQYDEEYIKSEIRDKNDVYQ